MVKLLCSGLLLLGLSLSSWADTLKSEAEIKQFSEKAMALIAKNEINAAFSLMKPYSIVPESEFQSIAAQMIVQREQFGARYGQPIGYEWTGEKKAGDSILRLIYVEKTTKTAMPWFFFFYKSTDGWLLSSVLFNDNIAATFQP